MYKQKKIMLTWVLFLLMNLMAISGCRQCDTENVARELIGTWHIYYSFLDTPDDVWQIYDATRRFAMVESKNLGLCKLVWDCGYQRFVMTSSKNPGTVFFIQKDNENFFFGEQNDMGTTECFVAYRRKSYDEVVSTVDIVKYMTTDKTTINNACRSVNEVVNFSVANYPNEYIYFYVEYMNALLIDNFYIKLIGPDSEYEIITKDDCLFVDGCWWRAYPFSRLISQKGEWKWELITTRNEKWQGRFCVVD